MFYLLSLFSGVLVALTVFTNGSLSAQHGMHLANVIIHITGLVLISAIVLFTRAHPFSARQKWYLYLGGAMGVLTVISSNFAFTRISVSALMAIFLFGQSVASLVIDQFGWLGVSKHPFTKKRIAGLLIILAGIAVMTDRFDFLAILVSFAGGVNFVVSRTLNGKLTSLTNARTSTFFNYLTGLALSAVFFLFIGSEFADFDIAAFTVSGDVYIYTGGIVGVCIVLITNYTVTKVPAFYLSILVFVSQVFAGILIDSLIARTFSPRLLIGGVLVALGLCVDLIMAREKKETSG